MTSGPLLAAVKAEETPLTLWSPVGEGGREMGDSSGCWISQPLMAAPQLLYFACRTPSAGATLPLESRSSSCSHLGSGSPGTWFLILQSRFHLLEFFLRNAVTNSSCHAATPPTPQGRLRSSNSSGSLSHPLPLALGPEEGWGGAGYSASTLLAALRTTSATPGRSPLFQKSRLK